MRYSCGATLTPGSSMHQELLLQVAFSRGVAVMDKSTAVLVLRSPRDVSSLVSIWFSESTCRKLKPTLVHLF